ncbi:MAG: hypothetical protein LBT43_13020 [Prevotella sp.]|jgi:hypothetical protein|nr:hypothetical protein [Prevotella sp.]
MNYKILVLIVFCFSNISVTLSQVTIGSGIEPNDDALLDLKENEQGKSTKGLSLPKVNLKSTNDSEPLTMHVEGMLVYNMTDINDVTPGVYYNDGNKWQRMDIPSGGQSNQVLSLSEELYPEWVTMDIPQLNDKYALVQFGIISNEVDIKTGTDTGFESTAQNCVLELDNGWHVLAQTPFSIMPAHSKNILAVTLQTVIQSRTDNYNYDGWVIYAGGIFINSQLQSVGLGEYTYTNSTDPFETITFYLIIEDLPVNEVQNINIAIARILSEASVTEVGFGTAATGVNNLNAFMARPSIAIRYYEDMTSSTN